MSPTRILVIGCSGSGKSTVAARLGKKLGLPFVPTDGAYWTTDWKPVPSTDVRRWVDDVTGAESWVLDGNFDADRDLVWARAQAAVWLDLPRGLTVGQAFRRNFGWWITGKRVWGGARMTLSKAWSGVRHSARSHALKRATYHAYLAEFPHLAVVRATSRAELEDWLAGGAAFKSRP